MTSTHSVKQSKEPCLLLEGRETLNSATERARTERKPIVQPRVGEGCVADLCSSCTERMPCQRRQHEGLDTQSFSPREPLLWAGRFLPPAEPVPGPLPPWPREWRMEAGSVWAPSLQGWVAREGALRRQADLEGAWSESRGEGGAGAEKEGRESQEEVGERATGRGRKSCGQHMADYV